MKGVNCALKLLKKRKKHLKKYLSPYTYTSRKKRKYHQATGIVIKFTNKEANQPNSAMRKCVVVEIKKTKQKAVAFIPKCGTRLKIKIHDEVLIQSIGGSKCRSKGDIAGVSFQVIKVNNICLNQMFLNKK